MKRIISIVLTITMAISIFASCGLEHFTFEQGETEKEENQYVTRAEWAEILGIYFGMDTCLSTEPYFADVLPSDAAFAYVQSCTEWEVFGRDDSNFNPEKEATVGFIVETAVKASEVDYSEYESPLLYAKLNGLEEKPSGDFVTMDYAMKVADWALQQYENKPFEEYQNIEYKENIINLPEVTVDEEGVLSANASQNDLKVGDVIVTAPTTEDPYGVARKVTSITYDENGQAIIETEQPEIGDLFEKLDFAYVGTVTDTSAIQLPEGVTLQNTIPVSYNDMKRTVTVSKIGNNVRAQQVANKGTNFTLAVNLGITASTSNEYLAIKNSLKFSQDPFALELFEKTGFVREENEDKEPQTGLTATDKYSTGWEIEGSISFSNFYIETEFETQKAFGVPYGIKGFEYEIHYEVTSSLKFAGKLEEEITIAMVPIALGTTGITVEVEIFANASVNGDIEISAKIANTTNVKYDEDSGYKKTQTSEAQNSVQISVKFKIGFGGKATIKALGIKLIDFKLSVGMGFDASAKLSEIIKYEDVLYKNEGGVANLEGAVIETLLCVNGMAYYPTVSLAIGVDSGTVAHKVGVKFTWKIMDKSGASFKSQIVNVHFELEKGFVEQCTIDTLQVFTDEEVTEALTEDANENSTAVGSDVMDISQYALVLNVGDSAKLSTSTLPYGYTGYDIVWFAADEDIIEVLDISANENESICKLVANSAGVTYIALGTSDGEHQLRCAVTVKDNGEIGFTPME